MAEQIQALDLNRVALNVPADPGVWIEVPVGDEPLSREWLFALAQHVGADTDEGNLDRIAASVAPMRASGGGLLATYWFLPSGRLTPAFAQIRVIDGLTPESTRGDILGDVPSTINPQVEPIESLGLGLEGDLMRVAVQDWSGQGVGTWYALFRITEETALLFVATTTDFLVMGEMVPHFKTLVNLTHPVKLDHAAESTEE